MRVLITGVSGLLGATLALELAPHHDVSGCFHSVPVSHPTFEAFACDLADANAVDALCARSPEVIIHCAAATNVDACEANPKMAERLNVEATRAVARAADRCGARLIAISTEAVFSGATGPFSELDPTRPLSEYARTKYRAEHVALSLGARALVIRTNIYGWNAQRKTSLAEWVLLTLRAGEVVPGFTDVVFTPMLANDLAEALRGLLGTSTSGVLHVAGSEVVSKYEFALAIAREFGLDEALVRPSMTIESGLTAPRSPSLALDCSRARAIGLRLPNVSEGLARFHNLERSGYPELLHSLVS